MVSRPSVVSCTSQSKDLGMSVRDDIKELSKITNTTLVRFSFQTTDDMKFDYCGVIWLLCTYFPNSM